MESTAVVQERVGRSWISKITAKAWGKARLKAYVTSGPAIFWFLLFLLVPLLFIVVFGFATLDPRTYLIRLDRLTLDNYADALANPRVFPYMIRTIIASVGATVGSLLIGYPVAYYMAKMVSDKTKGLLLALMIVPFWVSFIVQVYSLYPFVIEDGLTARFLRFVGLGSLANFILENFGLGTPNIVIPVLIFLWVPYMILPLFAALMKVEKELMEAAYMLGAGRLKTFWNVILPLTFPGIVTGSVLVFVTSFGSFIEPRFFSGQQNLLIGNLIEQSILMQGSLPYGAAISVLVLLVTAVMVFFYGQYAEVSEAGYLGERTAVGKAFSKLYSFLKEKVLLFIFPKEEKPHLVTTDPDPAKATHLRALALLLDRFWTRYGKALLGIFVVLFMISNYLPLIVVAVYSFNSESSVIDFYSFSLKWYYSTEKGFGEVRALFQDPAMLNSMQVSIIVALASTGISVLIGTVCGLALARYSFLAKKFVNSMVYTGLVVPSIVLGVSILVFVRFLSDFFLYPLFFATWETGWSTIIVGHTTFNIPIVILTVLVSLREFDVSLEEAAMNLGANEVTTFLRVTLPVIKPGIISGALLAFTFSFDEVTVSLFTSGQGATTMPVAIWSLISKKIMNPEINAASTFILLLALIFTLLSTKIQKGSALFRV